MSFRKIAIWIATFLISGSLFAERPLAIQLVSPKYYSQENFQRISEYFTCRENTSGDTILRTDPCSREGLYLIVKLNQPVCNLGSDAVVTLEYILTSSVEKQKAIFQMPERINRSKYLLIGITGGDWPCEGADIVAWSVDINGGACGNACRHSFLWGCRS